MNVERIPLDVRDDIEDYVTNLRRIHESIG